MIWSRLCIVGSFEVTSLEQVGDDTERCAVSLLECGKLRNTDAMEANLRWLLGCQCYKPE
jgi:hypothetical protein